MCKYGHRHIGQNTSNKLDCCMANVSFFRGTLCCALLPETARAALHVLFFTNNRRKITLAERPFGQLQHTVCIVFENAASSKQEQTLFAICLAWHTQHRDQTLHASPRCEYASPGTAQLSKQGLVGGDVFWS